MAANIPASVPGALQPVILTSKNVVACDASATTTLIASTDYPGKRIVVHSVLVADPSADVHLRALTIGSNSSSYNNIVDATNGALTGLSAAGSTYARLSPIAGAATVVNADIVAKMDATGVTGATVHVTVVGHLE